MYKAKYKLTQDLLANITQIERFYGQIEAIRIPKKLELNIEKKNLIESTYASNKIEGNPLTLPEVTNLLLDEKIPVNRDEKEVTNYFNFLSEIDKYQEKELTVNLVEEIHEILFKSLDEPTGRIRNSKVVIGKYLGKTGNTSFRVKHDPPFHTRIKIRKALSELFNWSEKETSLPIALKAGIFHHEFVYIHPFEDGNGRVCRILTALIFLKSGYHINKYFVLDDYYDIDRIMYSDMLHTADAGDKTEWLEYFTKGVKFSLQSALSRIKEAQKTLSIKDRPTKKEQNVLELMSKQLEIKSTELAEQLNVTRQQAHNLLSALVEKGLIERKGTTKSSYYVLK